MKLAEKVLNESTNSSVGAYFDVGEYKVGVNCNISVCNRINSPSNLGPQNKEVLSDEELTIISHFKDRVAELLSELSSEMEGSSDLGEELNIGKQQYQFKGEMWPIEIRPDIMARGGMKGKGASLNVWVLDNDKPAAKGMQGSISKKVVDDFLKKLSDKGMVPNKGLRTKVSEEEGIKDVDFEKAALTNLWGFISKKTDRKAPAKQSEIYKMMVSSLMGMAKDMPAGEEKLRKLLKTIRSEL